MELGAMLARESHVGQHIMFAIVHELRELGPAGTQLIGDMPPRLAGVQPIRLVERLTNGGGDNSVLAF